MKVTWPAPERNKQPILEVLQRVLPSTGTVLEIASGTGQHAVHFARELAGLVWQPSDVDEHNLTSIAAWVREAALPNLRAPIKVDVCSDDWGVGKIAALFNANMVHIAPWQCCEGLIAGAGRHLETQGALVMYGPFRIAGQHTSHSNEQFDASLKARDPSWGVRDCEAVIELASSAGVSFVQRVQMPANNQLLCFRRSDAGTTSA